MTSKLEAVYFRALFSGLADLKICNLEVNNMSQSAEMQCANFSRPPNFLINLLDL